MDSILILDTSVASYNKGDDIIMECTRKELAPLLNTAFEISLPTHVSPFHCYQVWRNSLYVQKITNCTHKFVGGSNLLVPDLLTHFPQWNINLFNYQPMKGCVLVGVGVGAEAEGKVRPYTKYIYRHLLSQAFFHSVRDERSKQYLERLGLKAINTGCVSMWMLTPEFCSTIPSEKANTVVFTITASPQSQMRKNYQLILDTLHRNYSEVYFWPQGIDDYSQFLSLDNVESVQVLPANTQAFDSFLTHHRTDYVGTRLHGGIYAMRHRRRSIIISIDERARCINEKNHLVCLDCNQLYDLNELVNSSLITNVQMDFDSIDRWKRQFMI